MKIILAIMFAFCTLFADKTIKTNTLSKLNTTLIKKGADDNNTLLLIGGIQGDEPGGFLAASLVATQYEIQKGSLWVVPNLNFPSIIKRSRGTKGDMNRKFAKINKNDPDYKSVKMIKKLIKDNNVSLILNLHDGSGFYRSKYIDSMHNPKRWGNSAIIDQKTLKDSAYPNQEQIAQKIIQKINRHLIKEEHRYRIKNTHTSQGDIEMAKSLTFYAVKHKKSAFANEASKSLPTHQRVYYHLLAIEGYFEQMGIEYKRGFNLTPKAIKNAINSNIYITINGKQKLKLDNTKNTLNYIPMPKKGDLEYESSNPLMAIIKSKNGYYNVHYGNRRLTSLKPQYFHYSNIADSVDIKIDGVQKKVNFGEIIEASGDFEIIKNDKIRTNIIGFVKKGFKNESGIKVEKNKILKRYSVDKAGNMYRIEFYENSKKNGFLGMVLVDFKTSTKRDKSKK